MCLISIIMHVYILVYIVYKSVFIIHMDFMCLEKGLSDSR